MVLLKNSVFCLKIACSNQLLKHLSAYKTNGCLHIAANPHLVEVVLLGYSGGLDTIWPCDISSGRQKWCRWGNWNGWRATEDVPWRGLWFWLWLPSSRCRGPCRLGSSLLLCLCLWHQVPQLPKEITSFSYTVQ